MLYNEHGWPGSGPGPVVSSGWMNKVVGYTLTKMQASKVVAAISVFGFDFNLATGRNTYVTYEMAAELATRHNSEITFDQNTLTPTFSYTDEQGNPHEVWFENSECHCKDAAGLAAGHQRGGSVEAWHGRPGNVAPCPVRHCCQKDNLLASGTFDGTTV